jgi:hypothetical protein
LNIKWKEIINGFSALTLLIWKIESINMK